jgi:hypothetical protein|tara:strand:+ start:130 stop:1002 length:873 start_codon:yes stop_codon:yes gene_type:complete
MPDPINQINQIQTSIPIITINGIPIRQIGINTITVADSRMWISNPPQAIPPVVPVTTYIGKPIVDIPGCVSVHKENAVNRNKNKQLVNDDPKGQTTLCDGGAPYYTAPEYDARELTWQTVYQEQEEIDEGVPVEPDTSGLETPEPPPTPEEKQEDPDCPPPNSMRIGDTNTAQTEKVSGYELQIDKNNPNGPKICVTLWEDIGTVEKMLPSVPAVSTTATIAVVATTSALLAKPLADLLLRVFKPVIKQGMTKIQKKFGKPTDRLSRSVYLSNQYRLKKGLPPLKPQKKK